VERVYPVLIVQHRHRRIARVSAHHQISHAAVEFQSVERGVRFDEPAVLLSVERGHDVADGHGLQVQPGRDQRQRTG